MPVKKLSEYHFNPAPFFTAPPCDRRLGVDIKGQNFGHFDRLVSPWTVYNQRGL